VEHSSEEEDSDEDSGAALKKPMKSMKRKKTMKPMKSPKTMKAEKPEDQRPEGQATLAELAAKTNTYIEKLGLTCAGVYYSQSASKFKINWQRAKGNIKGTLQMQGTSENDDEAKKALHTKFHTRAAAME